MGSDQQGLRIGIADAADAAATVEVRQILLELGAEGGVLDGVDLALESVLGVMDQHTAPAGTQMGVVVHSEKDIEGHVPLGNGPKKTTQLFAPYFLRLCRKNQAAPTSPARISSMKGNAMGLLLIRMAVGPSCPPMIPTSTI